VESALNLLAKGAKVIMESGLTMEYGHEACDINAVVMCLAMATILSPRHLQLHNQTNC